ncbi:MAG: pilus assembly protein, partial [Gammaproteobacteria bacterium]
TVDLTSAMQDSSHGFMLMKGMALPAGTVVKNNCSGSWTTLAVVQNIATNDTYDCIEYFPATYWLQAASPSAALALLPAGYGYLLTAVIAGGTGPAGEPMFGFEIQPANFSSGAQYNAAMQNFANWFSYYRKRHLALRASLSQTFMNLEGARVGMTYMNSLQPVIMYDMNSAADKQSLFTKFLDDAGSGGTPTWDLLNYIGKQYQRTDASAPITEACQKNFTIIFTDGYANYPYAHSAPVGNANVDSAMGAPYADGVGGTLGDVSAYYYLNNLRPDMTAGLVTPDPGCSAVPPQAGADCNTNLHMDTYGVTLVGQGLIWNVNMPATTDPYANPPPWPAAAAFANRNPTGIDDLWHATLDGHGEMLAAQTPQLIAQKLQDVLNSISARTGSDASVAANSSSLNTNTDVYQASFQSSDWTGNLVAYKVDSSGNVLLGSPLWDAQQLLDAQTAGSGWNTNRIIASWDPVAKKGEPFEWSNINAAQQTQLQPSDALGADRLNFLRGDKSNEQPNGDGFRSRTHILGDIVDSAPLYVGPPNGPYQDPSYVSFELAQASRAPMLFVGSNDGMLHAFDPTTGQEKFAFVPNGVFQNLEQLTATTYNQNHQYFVDGSPISGDVQFSDNSWHSILVGGLGAGGKSVFALDVTNPSAISTESTLASDVLWEFTDPLMGLSLSQPFIARTSVASTYSSTPFLVFFGSGYDNSDGNPYLYAVNAQTGVLIRRINLCAAVAPNPCNAALPNGLSSPVALNSGGALSLPDDTVYAGDLQGNLWKVSISDPNPANWTVKLLFQARDASNNPQPIMVAPVVSLHPNFPRDLGTIVYFGTGQLLGVPDLSTTNTQTFYGVWDNPASPATVTRSELVQQTLSLPTPGPSGTLVRTVSGPTTINWASQDGWYMDLSISGERVVSNPRLENGAVVFTTYIPTSSVCAVGGASWLLAVNFKNGSSFPDPELDLNNDGKLDSGDQVGGANPVGLYLGSVYAAAPTIISASLGSIKAVKLVSESNGTIKSVGQHGPPNQRQSWREIQPN